MSNEITMTLFKVNTLWGSDYYFWAESGEDAKQMFIEQGCLKGYLKDARVQVERVWANNTDSRYRGYVVQE